MQPIQVYQTDEQGIYIPSVDPIMTDVLDGHHLIPAGCKTTPPPVLAARQAARTLNAAVDAGWEVLPNWVGFEYWTADRRHHFISEVGIEPPAGHLTADPGPTQAQLDRAATSEAKAALSKSDTTVLRCFEAGIPLPEEWRNYRAALRARVTAGTGTVPSAPSEYPAGT